MAVQTIFKNNIRSFDFRDVLEAIGKAESRVIEIGQAIYLKYGRQDGRK